MIKNGRLRALALTSARRLPVLPEVATVAEQGYSGFEANDWKVLVAPAATPAAVISRINAELQKVLTHPDTISALIADGSTAMGGTSQQAAAFLKAEHGRWGIAVRDSGVKLD